MLRLVFHAHLSASFFFLQVKIRGFAFVEPLEEYRIDTTRAFAAMLRKMLNRTVIRVLNQRLEGGTENLSESDDFE